MEFYADFNIFLVGYLLATLKTSWQFQALSVLIKETKSSPHLNCNPQSLV